MKSPIWIDAQLSPAIAVWIRANFPFQAFSVRELGLRDAGDQEIFRDARLQSAVVMAKDSDFCLLQERFGPPPKILWITCGNTSNAELRQILTKFLPRAVELLESGEDLVEIA